MDAKQFAEHKKNCKKCNRQDLLILPVLQEIAPKESRSPELSGKFSVEEDILLNKNTNLIYTLRLVRPGFLYVYDSIQKTRDGRPNPWQGYIVSNLGNLTPYTAWRCKPNMDEPPPCDPYNCGMLARCISIKNPEVPRKIWIGFSDTMWTMPVFDKNEKKTERERHMRTFDVGQWWTSQTHDHACSLDQCKNHVLEMAQGVDTKCLEYSTIPLNLPGSVFDANAMLQRVNEERAKKGESLYPLEYPVPQEKVGLLMQEMVRLKIVPSRTDPFMQTLSAEKQLLLAAERVMGEKNKHRAAVVALNDPAGILRDLAVYMDYKHAKFEANLLESNNFQRKFYIASAIKGLETAVKNNVLEVIDEVAHSEPVALMPITGGATFGYGMKVHSSNIYNDPARLKALQDRKWERCSKKFDPAAIENTQNEYNEKLAEFDKANIVPLAHAWVSWFKSKRYVACMECNHDANDLGSGIDYAKNVSLCLGACQNKLPVIGEILEQLEADVTDHTKVLSRALMLNQDAFAKEVQNAFSIIKDDIDISDQLNNWGSAISAIDAFYDKAMKNTTLMSARNHILSLLTGQIIGAALNLMEPAITKGPVPKWLAKLGLAARMPIIRLELVGTIGEIADFLADHYAKYTKGVDKNLLRKSFEMKLQGSYKKPGAKKITIYAGVDEAKMTKEVAAAKNAAAKEAAVNSNVRVTTSRQRTPLHKGIDVLEFHTTDVVYRNKNPHTLEAFSRSKTTGTVVLPTAANIITAGLSIWMLNSATSVLTDELKNSGATQKQINEAYMSFVGVTALSLNSLGEAVEKMVAAAPKLAMFAPALSDRTWRFLKVGTKGLGGVGGGIIAVMDFREARKALANNQTGLAIAYFTVTLAGGIPAGLLLASVVAPVFGFTAVGALASAAYAAVAWPLLVIGVVGALCVLYFTDSQMEAWLGKCIFGNHTEKFSSLDEEVKGLRALGFDVSLPEKAAGAK